MDTQKPEVVAVELYGALQKLVKAMPFAMNGGGAEFLDAYGAAVIALDRAKTFPHLPSNLQRDMTQGQSAAQNPNSGVGRPIGPED